ncbi:MAG: hypothetical protein H7842_13180, partial [Gammaproteobacteria bacterium SHHR-1]
ERMELASKIVTADKDRKATESSDIKTLVDMQKALNERLLMEPKNETLRKQADDVNRRLSELMRKPVAGPLSLDALLAEAKARGATSDQLELIRAKYNERFGLPEKGAKPDKSGGEKKPEQPISASTAVIEGAHAIGQGLSGLAAPNPIVSKLAEGGRRLLQSEGFADFLGSDYFRQPGLTAEQLRRQAERDKQQALQQGLYGYGRQ